MSLLDLIGIDLLMGLSKGSPEIVVAIIDGPVSLNHPDLAEAKISEIPGRSRSACTNRTSIACIHGTFVLGMLAARRASRAPAICPDCTFLLRPIFSEISGDAHVPSAAPTELSQAIVDSVNAGALILNLSVGVVGSSSGEDKQLQQALNYAASRGAIPVVAAGNQGAIGSSVLTRHPWVLPVVGCDQMGRPIRHSNLAASFGRRGLCAPGESITSLGTDERALTMGGTSAATPFVTGAIALLWSLFPEASASEVRLALTSNSLHKRASLVPPLLNAWLAYQAMTKGTGPNEITGRRD